MLSAENFASASKIEISVEKARKIAKEVYGIDLICCGKMSRIDLTEWNLWFNKYVLPVFKVENREEYYAFLKRVQPPFYPKFWVAEKFYQRIKNDNRFDEELKMFFSFLYSCGFFMENIISFEDWLSMPNWWQPHQDEVFDVSILDILKDPNGLDYLKNKLKWLPFLSRPEGF